MSDEGPVRWVDKAAFVMPVLPPDLHLDPVLAALIHCMAFLELSGDEAVDPDWAIEAMEHVAHYLHRLSPAEAERITQQLAAAVVHGQDQGFPTEAVGFLATFLEHYGPGARPV